MLDIVLFVFGIMALGYLSRHFGLLSQDSHKSINDYVYYVSMPLLIFSKLAQASLGQDSIALLLANAIPIAAMMALVLAAWKLRLVGNRMAAVLLLTSFFGNIVYMGFPVVQETFGEAALAQAAMISFVYNLMLFSIGFYLISLMAGRKAGKAANRNLLGNTIIISCLAGAAFSIAGIQLPALLLNTIGAVGSTTAPLALFSVGLFLHGKKLTKAPSSITLLCAVKLLIFPAIFVCTAVLLGFRGQAFQVSLLEALMPIAVTNYVIAQKLGLDEDLVAESILASTLLSIPVLLGFGMLAGSLPL